MKRVSNDKSSDLESRLREKEELIEEYKTHFVEMKVQLATKEKSIKNLCEQVSQLQQWHETSRNLDRDNESLKQEV